MQWLFDIIIEMVLALLCTSTTRVYSTSHQSIPSGIWTTILFDAENWDINNEFTNYRFTAKEAGHFQVDLTAMGVDIAAQKRFQVAIYKNGAIWDQSVSRSVFAGFAGAQMSDLVYLNGDTDYIEGRVFQDTGVARNLYGDSVYTFMSIHQLSKGSWL